MDEIFTPKFFSQMSKRFGANPSDLDNSKRLNQKKNSTTYLEHRYDQPVLFRHETSTNKIEKSQSKGKTKRLCQTVANKQVNNSRRMIQHKQKKSKEKIDNKNISKKFHQLEQRFQKILLAVNQRNIVQEATSKKNQKQNGSSENRNIQGTKTVKETIYRYTGKINHKDINIEQFSGQVYQSEEDKNYSRRKLILLENQNYQKRNRQSYNNSVNNKKFNKEEIPKSSRQFDHESLEIQKSKATNILQLDQQFEILQKSIYQKRKEQSQLIKSNSKFTIQQSNRKNEIRQLNKEQKELRYIISQLCLQKQNCFKEIDEQKHAMQDYKSQCFSDVEKLQFRYSKCVQQIVESQKFKSNLNQQIIKLQAEIETSKAQLDGYINQIKSEKSVLDQLTMKQKQCMEIIIKNQKKDRKFTQQFYGKFKNSVNL